MYYRSVADMNEVILRGLPRIPQEIDLVVGIPRSGLLAANMVSLYMNRPLTDLKGLEEGRLLGKGKRRIPGYDDIAIENAKRILVVDDCVSQGTEMNRAREYIRGLGLADKAIFLTVFSFPEHPEAADIVLQEIPRPMCFQWSFLHTRELAAFALDIDGLICRDATKEEDDDGERYLRFLEHADPLLLPTMPVGWLVTSRLEKYRPQTEAWMRRHNVEYDKLIMLDVPTKADRERPGFHAQYKADAYKAIDAKLFVESSAGLADEIARLSGKPAMCLTSNRVIGSPEMERREAAMLRRRHLIRRMRSRIKRTVLGRGRR
ncbi:MAG: phosphoribosyltransferase family protein [Planctomycetota bacterium]